MVGHPLTGSICFTSWYLSVSLFCEGIGMPSFPKFRPGFRRSTTEGPVASSTELSTVTVEEPKRDIAFGGPIADTSIDVPPSNRPSEDVQRGVQEVEAVTLTWSRRTLIAVFLKYAHISHANRSHEHPADHVSCVVFGCSISSTLSSRQSCRICCPTSQAISSLIPF